MVLESEHQDYLPSRSASFVFQLVWSSLVWHSQAYLCALANLFASPDKWLGQCSRELGQGSKVEILVLLPLDPAGSAFEAQSSICGLDTLVTIFHIAPAPQATTWSFGRRLAIVTMGFLFGNWLLLGSWSFEHWQALGLWLCFGLALGTSLEFLHGLSFILGKLVLILLIGLAGAVLCCDINQKTSCKDANTLDDEKPLGLSRYSRKQYGKLMAMNQENKPASWPVGVPEGIATGREVCWAGSTETASAAGAVGPGEGSCGASGCVCGTGAGNARCGPAWAAELAVIFCK